jgi:HD-GYP domain-containing protein (c-di-GMP phosphodiesterase class II)
MLLAEQLVGEARERRASRMERRERTTTAVSAALFLVAATALATLLPNERHVDPMVVGGLVIGYACVLQVRFEFGGYYGSPEQLTFIPLLLFAPLPFLPLLVAGAAVLSLVPDVLRGEWHAERFVGCFADSWVYVSGAMVLALFAPGDIDLKFIDVYVLAVVAHFVSDFAWTLLRNQLLDKLPLAEVLRGFGGTARIDAILTPLAFAICVPAQDHPAFLLSIGPLVWLFHLFSEDRRERYSKALELQRAYRGTVMLLSDVVEADDRYTGQHSRSVVELVNSVADELGMDETGRQELEFAAMLHDVGKISIPKELLNKPAKLTQDEFELMKTHTIEGQFMLDRVGGLLARVGDIVRSCHERWDGAGYPDGLAGEEIPLQARIVFCCDAYHAMTSDRPYRAAMPKDAAIAELMKNAGTQFDAAVVAALEAVVAEGEPVFSASDQVRAILAHAPPAQQIPVRAAG